jgi:DNA sulfur modification protein DndE
MQLSRIRFPTDLSRKLIYLKSKTGLSANILCRYGFCLSLSEPGVPDQNKFAGEQELEITIPILTGQFHSLFIALLKQRMWNEDHSEKSIEDQFKAHMFRGVFLLSQRVKEFEDIDRLVQEFRI